MKTLFIGALCILSLASNAQNIIEGVVTDKQTEEKLDCAVLLHKNGEYLKKIDNTGETGKYEFEIDDLTADYTIFYVLNGYFGRTIEINFSGIPEGENPFEYGIEIPLDMSLLSKKSVKWKCRKDFKNHFMEPAGVLSYDEAAGTMEFDYEYIEKQKTYYEESMDGCKK